MPTSTLPFLLVDPQAGDHEGTSRHGCVVSPSPTQSSIRRAGVVDIPAIARIAWEVPQSEGIEAAAVSRATRLLLTHVAFEHGALWVEQVGDAPFIRAAVALPAEQVLAQHPALRAVIRSSGSSAVPPPAPVFGFGEVILAELRSARAVWLLIEFSKASQGRSGDSALLGAALEWTREHSEPAREPVMVLTDTMSARRAAESLGFIECQSWGRRQPWWLGIAGSVAQAFSA